ncbi:SGNH/GDSL hydrolase family protein [Pseudobacteriovorax antillogorgiicola]|uniref:GDSL-like Lipase/Acylhydrolase n=1 Tax=Pseudobacteriovorax antillogorgiicola TaxID=1513793 RepID=A0A1Y6B6Z1_9BACT|nr:SGNH/GDSL hydrolase family protein [Pseudobacteriovorax antillogorgiicola]TCS58695.1 GDSL-like lipase/acylhydrolase family protein [Pseudobacteriovorax antillogorgiicola]SME95753.1 GDSL-like Lipase/Acylhydrolase [Pseudobacteriovorax antillogorgiicola]
MNHIVKGSVVLGLTALMGACGDSNDDDSNPPQEQQSFDQNKEVVLTVYGDSISTGVLASTELGEQPGLELFENFTDVISSEGFTQLDLQKSFARSDVAASTSTESYGIPALVAEREGLSSSDVGVVSAAKFGGRLKDVDQMVEKVSQELGDKKSNYVFFMLGGNDFCADLTQDEFRTQYSEKLKLVKSNHSSDSQYLVGYVPPVYKILSYTYEYGPEIGGVDTDLASCEDFRKNTCEPLFRDDAQSRVEGFNQTIAELVPEILGDSVTLAEGIRTWGIAETELAFDCFHPNKNGQETLGSFFRNQ